MLSVVIATHDCERALVRTLAMLVPAAMTGAVRDVVVADAGSRDETAKVADLAGCTVLVSGASLAERLNAAAAAARAPWLMFLRPGVVLEPGWAPEAMRFIEAVDGPTAYAAVFRRRSPHTRPARERMLALLGRGFGRPSAEQGLVISRALYQDLGGHRAGAEPETDLLRRLGRRRIMRLASGATVTGES